MLHFKSPGILMAHCMQCFAQEAQSSADNAMAYEQGFGKPEWGCKDAGAMPIFNAEYCRSIFDNDYENMMEDNEAFTYDQLEVDLAEFKAYCISYFGADNMANFD